MPGIAGIITEKSRDWAVIQLRKMLTEMQHHPSYRSGTIEDTQAGVYAGWTARPQSFAAEMPIVRPDGSKTLLFAGEDYTSPDGHVLPDGNRPDRPGPSLAYLLNRADQDTKFPRSLNGRFHGILIDHANASAQLFNDRFGMERLYYYEGPDAFYFAAEAKAILAAVPSLRTPDLQSLGEFAACGCVLDDRTLFSNLFVLPGGSSWSFRRGRPGVKERYFSVSEWEALESTDSETYYAELKRIFAERLPRYFQGPGSVAISLTGGLDTRMIMAWADFSSQPVPTYTFGGPFRECHDVRIARKVAAVDQLPYQIIDVGTDYLTRFADYAERSVYLSDGCTAVTRGADLYANEIAARIAPVRLTGNYGSEILRRLRAFKPSSPADGLYTSEFLRSIARANETYQTTVNCHAMTFTAFRQAPWYQYGLLGLEQTQVTLRSPFLDNEIVRIAYQAPQSQIVKRDLFEDNDACSRLIADGSSMLASIPTDRGLGGRKGPQGALLRMLREFSFRAEYAYDYGMPQWLARFDLAASALHLERLILGRHKFTHFRVWYRDQLNSYVREMLLDSRSLSRPYLQAATVEAMVSAHLRGVANYTTEITRLLTMELQHRLFFD